MKQKLLILAAIGTMLLTACDAHIDIPDTAVKPGHILCTDGKAVSYAEYMESGNRRLPSYSTSTTRTLPTETVMPSICTTLRRRHSPTV